MRNGSELEAAAEQRLFEAALDEVVPALAPVRATGRSPRWLAAALALLGVAVVVGVVVTSRTDSASAGAPQQPEPMPPAVKVRGLAKLQELDRQTTNLCFELGRPEDLQGLADFANLRGVAIESDQDLGHEARTAAVWILSPLASCPKLEYVSLGYFGKLDVAEFATLARLPQLRSLVLVGRDKTLDAAFAAVLGKLPLRSLVLHAVHVRPEGLRALGELPLLERLELRDCTGLEDCDLRHLYRLRQLRALSLRGIGQVRTFSTQLQPGPISIQLPEVRDGQFVVRITAEWMQGLASALPDLRELDLSECRLDDDVLVALPRKLEALGIRRSLGYGPRGIAAVGALPELLALAFGDPSSGVVHMPGEVLAEAWLPLLQQKQLQRLEFAGVPKEELVVALRHQTGLRELRLDASPWTKFSFNIRGREGPLELPMPNFSCLADMPHLQWVELVRPSVALEQAVRTAVRAGVRVLVLPRP